MINKEILKLTLCVNVEDGVTAAGSVKTKAHNYSGIKNEAPIDKLHAAGVALGGLMASAVHSITLTEKATLEEAA